jgi:hypothetical protein
MDSKSSIGTQFVTGANCSIIPVDVLIVFFTSLHFANDLAAVDV